MNYESGVTDSERKQYGMRRVPFLHADMKDGKERTVMSRFEW